MTSSSDQKQLSKDQVDRLYRVAMLVSASRDEATALVGEAMRRAEASGDNALGMPDLYQVLWSVVRDRERDGSNDSDRLADSAAEIALRNQRGESALEHARSTVSRTFQKLVPEMQTVLALLEAERMSPSEVAAVTGMEEKEVIRLQERALSTFHDELLSSASDWSRERLIEDLPDTWLSDSVSHIVQSLGTAPKDLHKQIERGGETKIPPVSGPSLESTTHRTRPKPPTTIRPRSLITAVVMILVIGFGAKFAYERLSRPPDSNMISIVNRAADRFTPDLETDSATRIKRFLNTHLADDTPMPLIEGMSLTGAGIEEIAPGVRILGMRFVDATTKEFVTIYAVSYRFLERQSAVKLSNDVLRQIQSDADFDLHDLGSSKVLVWRHRAHIFLAVTKLDGRELRPRIYFPELPDTG